MAHYRKIDSRIQNDEKFCNLSDDGQLVFLLILTHPHLTALGAMRGSIPGLAAEKRWPEKRYRKAFQEAEVQGMIRYDAKSSMIWLPNFLKYNRPESPNVVRSWGASLELLPECNLKRQLRIHVIQFLTEEPKSFALALPKGFDKDLDKDLSKSMPNQEQEQKQKQEQKPLGEKEVLAETYAPPTSDDDLDDPGAHAPEAPVAVKQKWPAQKTFPQDFPRSPPDWFLQWAAVDAPVTDVLSEWPNMLDHEYPDAKTAFWACARKWMRNAPNFHRNGARASPKLAKSELTAEEAEARRLYVLGHTQERPHAGT